MKRLLILLGLAAALGAQEPVRWVQEAFLADPGPLDFVKGEGQEQFIAQSLCGDALVGLSAEGRPVPRLAASWKAVKGGLDLTLRGDARFADGGAVSAADVAWTFNAIASDPQASPTKRAALGDLKASGEGLHVSLRGSRSAARLLMELWRMPIARAGRADMGSGPFSCARDGSEWTFTARPRHFLHPRIPGLHFRLLPDESGRLVALQKGWLSLGVPPPQPGLTPPPAMAELIQPTLAQLIVWAGPGMDAGVARAFARWRRDAFPPALMGRAYAPAKGLWPAALGFAEMDPAPGPEPCPKALELVYTAGDGMTERLLQALAVRAARDGVTLKLRPMEAGLFIDQLTKGKLPLGAVSNVFDPDPWSVLGYVEPGGDLNFTGWSDAAATAPLMKLDAPESPAWKELQTVWARHPAALPLLDLRSVLWIDRRLEVRPSALGIYLATPGAAGWRWRE
ncbi:MAG TPA: ABC transporter substrate-binding protein [Holophagaceae bacterium]|nr:ABC transporter substrate-binding protein [Holophagaceae bacterium]